VSYRDDHDAAIARIDALERDNRQLAADTERLAGELAIAQQWLGGARRRMLVSIVFGALVLALLASWAWIIFRPTEHAINVHVAPPECPATTGVIVADGPRVGHWVATITSCKVHGARVELGTLANDDHRIWLDTTGVELELPNEMLSLDAHRCPARLDFALVSNEEAPPSSSGHVGLDCRFGISPERAVPDLVAGRIDFSRCR
jgi:hypothetical protein